MKKFLKLTFLIFSIFCFNNNVFAQLSAETFKELYVQNMLKTIIQSSHYNPPEIDDSLSLNTYNAYLKAVDNYKRFFTAADIKKLDAYKWQLDDEYNGDNMAFFDMSYGIISKRVTEAERYYIEATAEPFSFTSDDFVQMNPDSLKWAKDTTELLKRWYQMLKYETLVKIYNDNKAQEEKNGTTPKKTFSELEVTARESIRKRYKNWFDIMLKEDKTDYFDDYMNALLWSCDPHTNFFSPKDKEDFDIRFSGQLEGIGATLTLKDGYVTVTDIVPGSPSWKQGELEVNDKILKVAQGNLEAVDIVDMRLDKAVKLIRGPKGSEVRLTIQKINGTQKVISITRDVVIIEATYAKSMVITDKDNGKRIGYIYIPSFYANFNDAAGRRCSNDLKEELQKLKAENISGLIIDLRNNTGGSLTDCIDMAGMFIDIGPIVQVKSPAKALSYPDRYSGEIWDGPLVVMINQYSASASEIFAAALQDYKRAIIFGTTSYGKGTVQKFIDLDNLASDKLNSYKPLGSVKVTLQKFYRINGGSTQLIGVTPDISANSPYMYLPSGERESKNAMKWSEIDPVKYTVWPHKINYDEVIKNSKKRMQSNPYFTSIEEYARQLKQTRDNTAYSLNFDEFSNYMKDIEAKTNKMEELTKDTLNIEATIITPVAKTANDSVTIEQNNKWHKQLITDHVVVEALKICEDVKLN